MQTFSLHHPLNSSSYLIVKGDAYVSVVTLNCLHGGVSNEGALVLADGLSPLVRALLHQQVPPA